MGMNADSYFTIGKSHTVCQDYARSGTIRGTHLAYAIVSDGCSSSPDTDFGARILTMAALKRLMAYGDEPISDFDSVIRDAHRSTSSLMPSNHCLDATLLVAHEQDDGNVRVLAYGDGVILAIRQDGQIEAWEIDMAGYPGYLSYFLSADRMQEYLATAGSRTVRHWVNGELQGSDAVDLQVRVNQTSSGPMISYGSMGLSRTFSPDTYKCVMVATDGAMSFRTMDTQQPVLLPDVLPHMADIRSPTGEFMLRSSRFFMERTCPKLGWRALDDYGVAAIWMGDSHVA